MSDNQYFSTTELRDSVYDFDAKVEANKIASNAERTIKNAKDPYYLIGIHFAREKHSKELVDGFLKSKFEQVIEFEILPNNMFTFVEALFLLLFYSCCW